MKKARRALVLACGLVLLGATVGETQGFQGDPNRVAAVLSGGLLEDGRMLLALSGGPGLAKTFRLYSEPSHTPLAFAAEISFSESAEGEAWRLGWEEDPALVVLVGDIAEAGFERPFDLPPDDTRLALWTWGQSAGGGQEERVVADADVGQASFVVFSAPDEPEGQTTHCCGMEDGSESCVACPGAVFGCEPTLACGP